MADSTIISASLSDKDIKESIDKLVVHVDKQLYKMVNATDTAVELMKNSLKSLGDLKINFGVSVDEASSNAIKKQEEHTQEVKRTTAAIKEEAMSYDNIAHGIQAATNAQSDGARKYTEEILKQAKAIRESASWKETGHYLSSTGDVFYDKERASSTKREKEHMLSLEDQLVQAEQRRIDVERQASLELQTQTQAQNQLTQAAKGTQQIYESIQAMQVRSNKDVRAGGVKNTSFQNYEDFRMALAAVLGLQKEEIVLADSERASYEKLNTTLKQLRDTYNKLNASERDSENGKALVSSMLEVERSIQKIQRAAARPVDLKSALGLSENTLDDIAYKMQKLQLYRSGLDTSTQKGEIDQVNEALKRLGRTQREILGENDSLIKTNNALTRSFNYMKNRLVFYFTVGASTRFVKQLIEIRSQYELTERSLGILVGSAERGSKIFQQLSEMSLISPYTLIELSNAARQLSAYGVAAKSVVDTTRRLADISSAVGAPVERIAYALGHVQSYGYLTSLQARQFANSGIPLVKELANRYSELEGRMVTTADVYDMMKKKQVEYADVMDVVNKMTDEGGRFFDFQRKQADTLRVQLANLNLAWNNMLNDMGQSSQGILNFTIKSLKQLFLGWEAVSKAMYTIVAAYGMYNAKAAITLLMVGKETQKRLMNALAVKDETAATYESILAKKSLSKAQAQLLLAMNNTNVGLRTAVVNMKLLTAAEAQAIAGAGKFKIAAITAGAAVSSMFGAVVKGIKAIGAALASNVWLIAATAIADLIFSLTSLGKATEEVNEAIANSAKEASNSLEEFLATARKSGVYTSALFKTLSGKALENTWTNISEEIQNASAYGQEFLNQLMMEEDLSKRVSDAFRLAEHIQIANLKMKDFTEQVKISEDVWRGIFGEGLISDFVDYAGEALGTSMHAKITEWISGTPVFDATTKTEMKNEMEDLAKSIKEAFIANDITDEAEIRESLSRIREQIILQNKELKGDVADLFRLNFDKIMSDEFENMFGQKIYDKATSAWKLILETIRKDSGSAFSKITEDILDNNRTWSDKQAVAIEKAFEKVRAKMGPEFSDTLDEMQRMVNEREFKVKILGFFDIQQRDDIQKDFDKRFGFDSTGVFARYRRKTGEDDIEWEERLKKDKLAAEKVRDKELENEKKYSKDVNDLRYKNAISSKQEAEDTINAINNIAKAYNLNVNQSKEKARKAAESELQKALKEEIQLLDKARSVYKQLTKEGVDSNRALAVATEGYEETITHINSVLQKYGIQKFNLAAYAGVQSPHAIMELLQGQLDTLLKSGVAKSEEIKDLQVKLKDVKVDEVTFNQKTLTDSLNNELGKLKEEYELGVEFDANPELGNAFAKMFDIDTSELSSSMEEYMRNVQDIFDQLVNKNGWAIGLDIFKASDEDWDNWAKNVGVSADALKGLNKEFVGARDFALKYYKDLLAESKKLEYDLSDNAGKIAIKEQELADLQTKLSNATSETERRNIKLRIQAREEEISTLKESLYELLPVYQKVFGGIAEHSSSVQKKLTKNLLGVLEDAQKKGANSRGRYTIIDPNTGEKAELSAKQLGNAIKNVQKELGKSQNNVEKFVEAITKGKDEVVDIPKAFEIVNEELGKMQNLFSSVGSLAEAMGADEDTVNLINQLGSAIGGMGDAIGGIGKIMSGDILGGISSIIGGLASVVGSLFGLGSANKEITRQIERSEKVVRKLELAYKDLEAAIEDAYGAEKYGLQQAEIASKQAQLAELNRQLELEQSRDSKHYDQEKIDEYREQIKDLENEIKNATNEIVKDMLGISSVGNAAEELVSSMIDAFRQGEDYMASYGDSFDKMVNNMIVKAIASRVIGDRIQSVFDELQSITDARTEDSKEKMEYYTKKLAEHEQALDSWVAERGSVKYNYAYYKAKVENEIARVQSIIEQDKENLKKYTEDYKNAATLTPEDVQSVRNQGEEFKNDVKSTFEAMMEAFGVKFGEGAEAEKLSNLQQGIQGITEDTAGSIEAYLNGVSQQVYLHSDLLTQIRDAVVGFDMDVQLATQAQILMQLQNSYQTQQAIRNILESTLVPSGRAFAVELIS